ncbi:MAG: alpha/beta hydrolase [Anaerolineales bacterium]
MNTTQRRWIPWLLILAALLLLMIVLLVSGVFDPLAKYDQAWDYTPVFERAACQFDVPPGYVVDCGYLTVPEDRSQSEATTIRLHFAVFKSTGLDPAPDPVIHLYGGPGGSLLDNVAFYMQAGGDEILQKRDYVMFNQRGTRYADPFLDCPGSAELAWEAAREGLNFAERDAKSIEFMRACQQEFLNQGVNLAAYNSVENAADVRDLSLVLGYEQVNLYGVSYGARLALTVMRDHPDIVRSAIIDSGYPTQVYINNEFALSAARAFDLIFDSCEADFDCRTTYPDLETTFYRVVDTLNADPVRVSLSQGTVFIDGDNIIDLTFGSLYTFYGSDGVTWIPHMITIADQGNLSYLTQAFEVMFAEDDFSEGMYYSVICREEVPEGSYENARALAADLPSQIRDHYVSPSMFAICEAWASGGISPDSKQPIYSSIPTLVLTGQYDPITPPPYNQLVASTLSDSFFYEIPGIGHGAMRGSECALEIGLQFLDDPTIEPDDSCIIE